MSTPQNRVDRAAAAVANVKRLAGELSQHTDQIRTLLHDIERETEQIRIVEDSAEFRAISARFPRLRELLNMQEMGSFALKVNSAADAAYSRLY